jgi:hypothetical protein
MPRRAFVTLLIFVSFFATSGMFALTSSSNVVAELQLDGDPTPQQTVAAAGPASAWADPRSVELAGVRLLRESTLPGQETGARAQRLADARRRLDEAAQAAPARATVRMHGAFAAAAAGDLTQMDARIRTWHAVAPHDGATQPWRLALAVAHWEALSPPARALALADLEDVCVRSGEVRARELVDAHGVETARMAATIRLARRTRPCAGYGGETPAILSPDLRGAPPRPPVSVRAPSPPM